MYPFPWSNKAEERREVTLFSLLFLLSPQMLPPPCHLGSEHWTKLLVLGCHVSASDQMFLSQYSLCA